MTLADELIDTMHPRYVILDAYQFDCAFDLEKDSSHVLKPAYVTFMDAEKQQPAVIVYGIAYSKV